MNVIAILLSGYLIFAIAEILYFKKLEQKLNANKNTNKQA
jgi:hypothetical protein